MSTRTRRDWILWGALGCALVSTAHAEYTLATAAHFNEYVALAVPGALDLYVIRALQQRRDVFVAVLAMVAANIASHLITGGVLEVRWPVIAAVGAVAPLIVWRVYSLKYTRTRQELLWGTEAGPVSEPVLEASAAPSAPVPAWAPGFHLDGCDGVHPHEGPVNCMLRADALEGAAPDTVPEWMHAEYPPSAPPYLHSVPALPPEYVSSAEELSAADLTYLPLAREYTAECMAPSIRGLMKYAKVGQDRAGRLLDYLEAEETT